MTKKAKLYDKLKDQLQSTTPDSMAILLSNWFDSSELEEFMDFMENEIF